MILAATQRIDPRIDLLQSAGMPFVTLGRSTSGHDYSWIDLDFEGVANAAVDRLVAKGHRRIALTVPAGNINFGPIFEEAYRQALERNGLVFDPQLVMETRRHEGAGYALVDQALALADPPTAILLIFETAAIGMYRRLAELGLNPGADLAIIGFRDEPTVRFLSPSLTCFSASLHDLGVELARALLAQMPAFADQIPQQTIQVRAPLAIRPGDSD
jgi:DNA-binding LacI/PurR family transcriptional regulator